MAHTHGVLGLCLWDLIRVLARAPSESFNRYYLHPRVGYIRERASRIGNVQAMVIILGLKSQKNYLSIIPIIRYILSNCLHAQLTECHLEPIKYVNGKLLQIHLNYRSEV